MLSGIDGSAARRGALTREEIDARHRLGSLFNQDETDSRSRRRDGDRLRTDESPVLPARSLARGFPLDNCRWSPADALQISLQHYRTES